MCRGRHDVELRPGLASLGHLLLWRRGGRAVLVVGVVGVVGRGVTLRLGVHCRNGTVIGGRDGHCKQ